MSDLCTVRYVDGGYVQGDTAGGFAGDFQSGKINDYTMQQKTISGTTYTGLNPIDNPETPYSYTYGTELSPWSVYNIDYVRGGRYAGGWGGKVYPGALASAGGGGLSVLGGAASATLDAGQLLGLASVYVPTVKYAGVYTYDENDFSINGRPS